MTLTATAEPGSWPPRVRLNVSGRTSVSQLQVVRVAADRATELVRSPVKLTGGVGVAHDPEVPFGFPVSYRTVESSGAESSGVVTLDSAAVWLVHPFVPSLSMAVVGSSLTEPEFAREAFDERDRPTSSARVLPLNRRKAITQRASTRQPAESRMVVRTWTLEQATAMEQLTDDDSPLLLNVSPDLRWGLPTMWVQLGDAKDRRLGIEGAHEAREWVLPYTVVDRPEGDAAPSWTYDDLSATLATYDDMPRTWSVYNNLEADRRGGLV